MDKKNILISSSTFGEVNPAPLHLLQSEGFEVTLNPYRRKLSVEESKNLMPGHIGMIAGTEKLNDAVFSVAPSVKYVCRLGAGMDSVDLSAAREHGVVVENTPTAHVDGVAELTLAGILDLQRKVAWSDRNIRSGVWEKPMGRLLKGKTLGIIGLGKVGKRLVELLTPFGIQCLAFDQNRDDTFAEGRNVEYVELNKLLENSDIISIHTPYTSANYHLLGIAEMERLKPTAMIVNVSRGGLIDEEALCDFLTHHPAASAYLDTFEQEPYSGPLREKENVLLTPHIGSYAREVREQMEMEAAENIIEHFNAK